MKVTGPGSGLPTETPATTTTNEAGKAFAEKLSGPGGAKSAETSGVPAADVPRVADIGADLQAGRLTPAQAIDKVLTRIVDEQVGAHAVPGVRHTVEAALREALESDPLLAGKVARLTGSSG